MRKIAVILSIFFTFFLLSIPAETSAMGCYCRIILKGSGFGYAKQCDYDSKKIDSKGLLFSSAPTVSSILQLIPGQECQPLKLKLGFLTGDFSVDPTDQCTTMANGGTTPGTYQQTFKAGGPGQDSVFAVNCAINYQPVWTSSYSNLIFKYGQVVKLHLTAKAGKDGQDKVEIQCTNCAKDNIEKSGDGFLDLSFYVATDTPVGENKISIVAINTSDAKAQKLYGTITYKVQAIDISGNAGGSAFNNLSEDAATFLNPMKFSGGKQGVIELIGRGIRALMYAMGSILFALYVYAGILWMTSSGSSERVGTAKKIVVWSTLGVIVQLSAYMIVNFVFKFTS